MTDSFFKAHTHFSRVSSEPAAITVLNVFIGFEKMASGPTLAVPLMPWESRGVWESRISFIEDNLNKFGLDKVLALSMMWANMEFLGCRYPEETEALVRDYSLPKDREVHSPEGNVYHIDVSHNLPDATPMDPGVDDPESVNGDEGQSEISGLDILIKEAKQRSINSQSDNKEDKGNVEGLALLLEGHWVKQYLKTNASAHPVSLLHGICAKHELSVEFPIKTIIRGSGTPSHQACLVVNNDIILKGEFHATKKEAKRSVAERVVNRLKEMANSSQIRTKVKVETVHRQELHKPIGPPHPDYGKGSELLQKMGWKKNEPLGKDPMVQCTTVPVIPVSSRTKGGLGFEDTAVKIDSGAIRRKLRQFMDSDQDVMEFPVSLTAQERRMVHEEAQHFGLVHKSFGTGSNKFIVVRKKTGEDDHSQQYYGNHHKPHPNITRVSHHSDPKGDRTPTLRRYSEDSYQSSTHNRTKDSSHGSTQSHSRDSHGHSKGYIHSEFFKGASRRVDSSERHRHNRYAPYPRP